MDRAIGAAFAVGAGLWSSGCAHVDAVGLARNYARAWNARDVNALATMYADTATLHAAEGGVPRAGRADIKGYLRALFASCGAAQLVSLSASSSQQGAEVFVDERWELVDGRREGFVSHDRLKRGPDGAWQIIDSTWAPDPPDASRAGLGEACLKDLECRGLAVCDEGRCLLAVKH
jgi:ketosteroid isomerase-like protein